MNENLMFALVVAIIMGSCVGNNYIETYKEIETKK